MKFIVFDPTAIQQGGMNNAKVFGRTDDINEAKDIAKENNGGAIYEILDEKTMRMRWIETVWG